MLQIIHSTDRTCDRCEQYAKDKLFLYKHKLCSLHILGFPKQFQINGRYASLGIVSVFKTARICPIALNI